MKKLFTLLTLALVSIGSAWGETGTETIAAGDWSSGKVYSGTSVSGIGTYSSGNGGGNIVGYEPSNKGVKLNVKSTKVTVSGTEYGYVILTVNTGYTVKSLKLEGTSNGNNTIILKGVYEDVDADNLATSLEGATNKYSTGKTFPNKSTTYVSSDVVSLNATSNIVLLFDSSSDTQMRAIFTLGWESAGAVTYSYELKDVEINGSAISASDLSTLKTSHALTNADAFDILPPVKYTVTKTTFIGGVNNGTEDTEYSVTPAEDGDKYVAKFNVNETDYAITFTNINLVTCLDVTTNNTEVILSQDNIAAKGYLDCNDTHFSDKGWPAPYNGNFLDMKSGRTIKITVKNVTAFEVYASGKDGEDRPYTVKVGDAEAKTYYQHSSASILPSGVIATGTTDEVEIVLEGGSSSVYPAYIVFNPAVDAEITSAGYATFSSDKAVDFSGASGVTVYAAKVNGTKTAVDLIEVKSKQVPANIAVVLKGAAGKYTASAIASAATISGNQLTIAETTMNGAAGNIYVLNEKDGVVGFYKLSATGSLLAGKGYLEVDGVGEGRTMFEIDIDGISTGINMVNGEGLKVNGSETYYDLQGRRVLNPTKGLYIVNGKKVIMK